MKTPPGMRHDYLWFTELTTRWMDNDVFRHINNVVFYSYFDTIANQFLIDEGGFDFVNDDEVGYVVESGCRYHAAVRHPCRLTGGLRIAHIGRSSVRYEMAVFAEADQAAAEGHFTHVFVERASERPTPIPARIRAAMERVRKP
ncbi:MAG: thioesterase family protein [Pseudomonadota bacterium]